MHRIDFHFDFGSPNAYLAHRAITQIERRSSVKFDYVPVLLGGVFKATNNVSPMVSLKGIKNKPEYAKVETQRFLKHYGLQPYVPNPHFPVNTLAIMRGAVYAQLEGFLTTYVDAIYDHMWQRAQKLDDLEIVAACLEASNLPTQAILSAINDPEIKARLINQTTASVEKGTFGSPTFYLNDEIFFGKESLREIEALLALP